MLDFTIAIPTCNGADRLPELLHCLRSQVVPQNFSWEVLIVDNNSSDRTAEVVADFQSGAANLPCSLRYLFEPRQGAGFARQLAVHQAKSELIGFLDDDNLPDDRWITAAYEFAQAHAQAGAIASRIRGEFEVTPASELKPLLPFLALTDRGDHALRYDPQKPLLPPSAGLVVRRSAWLAAVPVHLILSGRTAGSMVTGEDLEVLAYLQRSGWEIWYNPQMRLRHKIPAGRLEADYLISFFRGIGLSRYATRMARIPRWQQGGMTIAYILNDLRKLLLHRWNPGEKGRSNVAVICQQELIKSSLISPFYLWKHGYFRRSG